MLSRRSGDRARDLCRIRYTAMRDLIFQIKHSMSCLADKKFRVLIDDEKMIVTVIANVFDSSLIGWILTKALPEEHEVVAFSDDNSGWIPKRPPYSLRIRIGGDDGQEFDAEAVRLSSVVWGDLQVSITLAPIKTADVRRDMDVTELKGMFGEPKKVMSIKEMNAEIAARGAAD